MKLSLIWAEDEAGWIGKGQTMPWHLSADLKHFKQVTIGHPIIMGRTTFASLGNRPLPKRTNIVLTHQELAVPGVVIVHSIEALKEWLASQPVEEAFVIGGARIYDQLMPLADQLYRTVIKGDHHGDTKMAPVDYEEFDCIKKTAPLTEGETVYWFETWQRH